MELNLWLFAFLTTIAVALSVYGERTRYAMPFLVGAFLFIFIGLVLIVYGYSDTSVLLTCSTTMNNSTTYDYITHTTQHKDTLTDTVGLTWVLLGLAEFLELVLQSGRGRVR